MRAKTAELEKELNRTRPDLTMLQLVLQVQVLIASCLVLPLADFRYHLCGTRVARYVETRPGRLVSLVRVYY